MRQTALRTLTVAVAATVLALGFGRSEPASAAPTTRSAVTGSTAYAAWVDGTGVRTTLFADHNNTGTYVQYRVSTGDGTVLEYGDGQFPGALAFDARNNATLSPIAMTVHAGATTLTRTLSGTWQVTGAWNRDGQNYRWDFGSEWGNYHTRHAAFYADAEATVDGTALTGLTQSFTLDYLNHHTTH